MFDLQRKIQQFAEKGYINLITAACKHAQGETRAFIARTHPHTAFGGQVLDGKQFVEGRFDIEVDKVLASVYANYLARWYNTGARQHIVTNTKSKYAGRKTTHYPARGSYFETNAKAIEQYFADAVDKYMEKELGDEWLQQK